MSNFLIALLLMHSVVAVLGVQVGDKQQEASPMSDQERMESSGYATTKYSDYDSCSMCYSTMKHGWGLTLYTRYGTTYSSAEAAIAGKRWKGSCGCCQQCGGGMSCPDQAPGFFGFGMPDPVWKQCQAGEPTRPDWRGEPAGIDQALETIDAKTPESGPPSRHTPAARPKQVGAQARLTEMGVPTMAEIRQRQAERDRQRRREDIAGADRREQLAYQAAKERKAVLERQRQIDEQNDRLDAKLAAFAEAKALKKKQEYNEMVATYEAMGYDWDTMEMNENHPDYWKKIRAQQEEDYKKAVQDVLAERAREEREDPGKLDRMRAAAEANEAIYKGWMLYCELNDIERATSPGAPGMSLDAYKAWLAENSVAAQTWLSDLSDKIDKNDCDIGLEKEINLWLGHIAIHEQCPMHWSGRYYEPCMCIFRPPSSHRRGYLKRAEGGQCPDPDSIVAYMESDDEEVKRMNQRLGDRLKVVAEHGVVKFECVG